MVELESNKEVLGDGKRERGSEERQTRGKET